MAALRYFLVFLLALAGSARAEEFLDPEIAFKPSVKALDANTLEFGFAIAPGYYIYRDKLRFAVTGEGATLGAPAFPPGKTKHDEYFGEQVVYAHDVAVPVPVQRSGAAAQHLVIELTLQGCAEGGFCYPPQPHTLEVDLPAGAAAPAQPVAAATATATAAPAAAADESGRIAQSLRDTGFLGNLLVFFIAGLGLALTPCVFPMIPILSGIIVGQGASVSRGRGFALSVAYVLGMAVTYAAAGTIAGLTGTLISNSLQNPWVLGSFALVFVLLSLSMFGFYELQVPAALQTRISEGAGRIKGGQSVGVFVMGALSALIVGPCVAAPLAGALLYIGQTGNALLGGSALFAMALGMGVPLLLVGLSAGTLLPRAGAWMEAVKKFFGVVLLATAVQLLAPVIPVAAQMIAWALLLIVPAIYVHALDPLPPAASGWHRLWKGLGIVMLLTGSALLLGVLAGNRDPLQPLAGVQSAGFAVAPKAVALPFERIATVADLDARVQAAVKPVMLDFYADWCVACKEMEHLTFSDPAVRSRLDGFELLQVDVTENDADDKALLKRFGLFGPPGIVFFDAGGSEIAGRRVVGFQDAERFLQSIAGIN